MEIETVIVTILKFCILTTYHGGSRVECPLYEWMVIGLNHDLIITMIPTLFPGSFLRCKILCANNQRRLECPVLIYCAKVIMIS